MSAVETAELLTSGELARRLRIAPSSVDHWRRAGGIRPVKGGGGRWDPFLYDVDEVSAFLEAGGMTQIRRRQGLRATEVCELTGITYRMLDYWTNRGLIEPVVEASGSGSHRYFDPSVVDQIADIQKRIAACPLGHPGHGDA